MLGFAATAAVLLMLAAAVGYIGVSSAPSPSVDPPREVSSGASPAGLPSARPEALSIRPAVDAARLAGRHAEALQAAGLPEFTGSPLPRRPLAKEELRRPLGSVHALTVKFRDDLLARAGPDGGLVLSAAAGDGELARVVREHGLTFAPGQTASEKELALLEARALANTRTQPADLGGVLSVRPSRADADGIWAAAQALQALDSVEFVSLSSLDRPPPPPLAYDLAPVTASFTGLQAYRTAEGINLEAAWASHGARGRGVRVTDCEYSFNPQHEDLRNRVTEQPGLDSYYPSVNLPDDHGTAVLGMLTAAENGYGMTGMVPEAEVRFYAEYAMVRGALQTRAAAITAALAASGPGDVVLLEMQAYGSGATDFDGRYVPAEYALDVWLAVKTGTDAGMHVVAAAGNGGSNGGENLDSAAYKPYRDRGDSGAIIVGAGTRTRAKTDYSTYGSRVNLQGWGDWSVATLGYGDLQTYADDPNQKYSGNFSGTSSASPMVTAVVAAVESVTRLALGRPLSPVEMRQLLVLTGKAQTGDTSKRIGPLPDVAAALGSKLAGFPVVTSVSPGRGGPGAPVVISGAGFAGATAVRFGGVEASFTVLNASTVQATVPAAARTGRITVTAPSGTGVGAVDFRVAALSAVAAGAVEPASLAGFAAHQGSVSPVQTFSLRADNLDAGVMVIAPAGFEVSLDGVDFGPVRSLPASLRRDAAANYAAGWTNGANAGLGFGRWAVALVQDEGSFAGHFLGNPAAADLTGLAAPAFGLYANPSNSRASVRTDRPLARPLKAGDSLKFQWAVNWDADGSGVKGFVLSTGGEAQTELLRVEQSGFPGAVVLGTASGGVDTGIAYGNAPMTWTFTPLGVDTLQVTATGRGGGTNVVFSTNVAVAGFPDSVGWYAARLDSSGSPADNDKRQPYFNNLEILSGTGLGGLLPATTLQVRLAAEASPGLTAGNITVASAGVPLGSVAVSGNVALDYDAWARAHGLEPAGNGARTGDPDRDLVSNRVEFAFGTDPSAANGALAVVEGPAGARKLTFLALTAGADYTVQVRPDLGGGSWAASGLVPVAAVDQGGVPAGYRRMECALPVAAKAFYRVLALLP